MAIIERTYAIDPPVTGDTSGIIGGLGPQDPTLTFDECGRDAVKPFPRTTLYFRYTLDIPKGSIIRKVKFRHFSQQNSTVVTPRTYFMGLLEKDGLWNVDGWTTTNYPTGLSLPNPTADLSGFILPGRLVGDQFFGGSALYSVTQYFSGATITIGEGYSGMTFDLTDVVGQLQSWIDSSDYDLEASDAGATGIVIDSLTNPGEKFWIFMDDDPILVEPGQTMTVEFEIPSCLTYATDIFAAVSVLSQALPAVSAVLESRAAVMALAESLAAVEADPTAYGAAVEAMSDAMGAVMAESAALPAVEADPESMVGVAGDVGASAAVSAFSESMSSVDGEPMAFAAVSAIAEVAC